MTTILIALVLYVAFVILVFIARFITWIIAEIKKENARIRAKQAAKERSTRAEKNETATDHDVIIIERKQIPVPTNAATIAAYNKQKQIILERIEDLEETLDLAPRGLDRDKLQEKRIKLYNDLANIENKIYRVSK